MTQDAHVIYINGPKFRVAFVEAPYRPCCKDHPESVPNQATVDRLGVVYAAYIAFNEEEFNVHDDTQKVLLFSGVPPKKSFDPDWINRWAIRPLEALMYQCGLPVCL